MDPQACFDQWCVTTDYPHAVLLMNSYHDWLMKGGFKAKTKNGHEVEWLKTLPTLGDEAMQRRYAIFMGGQRRWISV